MRMFVGIQYETKKVRLKNELYRRIYHDAYAAMTSKPYDRKTMPVSK
jgi:hypothetical protein